MTRVSIKIKNTTDEQTMIEVITVLQELITLPYKRLPDKSILVAYPSIYPMDKFYRFLEILDKCEWGMQYD